MNGGGNGDGNGGMNGDGNGDGIGDWTAIATRDVQALSQGMCTSSRAFCHSTAGESGERQF